MNSGSFNQVVIDLILDEQSFEHFMEEYSVEEFSQDHPHCAPIEGECALQGIKVIDPQILRSVQAGIRALEEALVSELGPLISFDSMTVSQTSLNYQLRLFDASEEDPAKIELWALFDNEKQETLKIVCKTLYSLSIRKNVSQQVQRSKTFSYE